MRTGFIIRKIKVIRNLITFRYITSKSAMDIQTFAFLDTETTGLPYQQYNKTKITELCVTIVQSNHISLGVYPRVQNKLNFCFNPCKMVNPEAENLTGLSNILLEHQSAFTKETVDILENFLSIQRKPVCFIAHNGYYFDYPILRAEIYQTGAKLSEDILCIDSLVMFRDLHRKHLEKSKNASEKMSGSSSRVVVCEPVLPSVPIELSDGYDELICQAVDEYEKIQKINETTPRKGSQTLLAECNPKISNELYFEPIKSRSLPILSRSKPEVETEAPVTLTTAAIAPAAKKQLNFGKLSFKLGDVYQRLTLKSPVNAHRAEDDCNMLLECAATLGQEFVDWANLNAVRFCDIEMMQPGKKIVGYVS